MGKERAQDRAPARAAPFARDHLAQHPSRAIILRLTRLGGILFETRYRAGYDWIEILCHQPEKTPVGGVVEASDDDQPWTKLRA